MVSLTVHGNKTQKNRENTPLKKNTSALNLRKKRDFAAAGGCLVGRFLQAENSPLKFCGEMKGNGINPLLAPPGIAQAVVLQLPPGCERGERPQMGNLSPVSPPTSDQKGKKNKTCTLRQQKVEIRVKPRNEALLSGSAGSAGQVSASLRPQSLRCQTHLPRVGGESHHRPEEEEKPPGKAAGRAAAFIFGAPAGQQRL